MTKSKLNWDPEAKQRLRKVPFLIRRFVRLRAEEVALERGLSEVTAALLDEIKHREHKGPS